MGAPGRHPRPGRRRRDSLVSPTPMPAPATDMQPPTPRLTVREMQIALEAAHTLAAANAAAARTARAVAGDDPGAHAEMIQAEGDLTGSRSDDALDASAPPSTSAVPATHAAAAVDGGDDADSSRGPWLPEHDGPVSLAGISVPRTRPIRRQVAVVDSAGRRPTQGPARRMKPARAELQARAALGAAPAPRIVIHAACGGAGATTLTVLLAAAAADLDAVVLAGPADRGALSLRAGAEGGDLAALAQWALSCGGAPLTAATPGLGTAVVGEARLRVVAATAQAPALLACREMAALLAAAQRSPLPALLDCSVELVAGVSDWATHIVIAAPHSTTGMLAAEAAAAVICEQIPRTARLAVATVDVAGRAPRRAARAAAARLQSLHLPTVAIPFDARLTDNPHVAWTSLRPRTRSAVCAGLTHLITGKETR